MPAEDHPGARTWSGPRWRPDERHRDDREGRLEGHPHQDRDAVRGEQARRVGVGNVVQAEQLERIAEPAGDVFAPKATRVAVEDADDADDADGYRSSSSSC